MGKKSEPLKVACRLKKGLSEKEKKFFAKCNSAIEEIQSFVFNYIDDNNNKKLGLNYISDLESWMWGDFYLCPHNQMNEHLEEVNHGAIITEKQEIHLINNSKIIKTNKLIRFFTIKELTELNRIIVLANIGFLVILTENRQIHVFFNDTLLNDKLYLDERTSLIFMDRFIPIAHGSNAAIDILEIIYERMSEKSIVNYLKFFKAKERFEKIPFGTAFLQDFVEISWLLPNLIIDELDEKILIEISQAVLTCGENIYLIYKSQFNKIADGSYKTYESYEDAVRYFAKLHSLDINNKSRGDDDSVNVGDMIYWQWMSQSTLAKFRDCASDATVLQLMFLLSLLELYSKTHEIPGSIDLSYRVKTVETIFSLNIKDIAQQKKISTSISNLSEKVSNEISDAYGSLYNRGFFQYEKYGEQFNVDATDEFSRGKYVEENDSKVVFFGNKACVIEKGQEDFYIAFYEKEKNFGKPFAEAVREDETCSRLLKLEALFLAKKLPVHVWIEIVSLYLDYCIWSKYGATFYKKYNKSKGELNEELYEVMIDRIEDHFSYALRVMASDFFLKNDGNIAFFRKKLFKLIPKYAEIVDVSKSTDFIEIIIILILKGGDAELTTGITNYLIHCIPANCNIINNQHEVHLEESGSVKEYNLLMAACSINNEDMVEILLMKGACPLSKTTEGNNAFDIVINLNFPKMFKLLYRYIDVANITHNFVSEYKSKIMKLLDADKQNRHPSGYELICEDLEYELQILQEDNNFFWSNIDEEGVEEDVGKGVEAKENNKPSCIDILGSKIARIAQIKRGERFNIHVIINSLREILYEVIGCQQEARGNHQFIMMCDLQVLECHRFILMAKTNYFKYVMNSYVDGRCEYGEVDYKYKEILECKKECDKICCQHGNDEAFEVTKDYLNSYMANIEHLKDNLNKKIDAKISRLEKQHKEARAPQWIIFKKTGGECQAWSQGKKLEDQSYIARQHAEVRGKCIFEIQRLQKVKYNINNIKVNTNGASCSSNNKLATPAWDKVASKQGECQMEEVTRKLHNLHI